jgi:phage tail sheath gpL-like
MYKTVICITIAGMLCVAAGTALAQASSAGRAPATGVAAIGNIAVPSVSALNRPIAVPVARAPDLVAGTAFDRIGAAPGLSVTAPGRSGTALGLSVTAPGRSGAAPGLSVSAPGRSGTAPGLINTSTDQEKSAKESDSARSEKNAALAIDEQQKRLHQVPTCN